MRIGVLPSAYRPSIGGVEELSRQLAMAYVRKGHDVVVVTNRWPRDLPREEQLDGISVYRLPFRLPHRSVRGRMSYPLTNGRVSRTLDAIVRRHGIDVLHVQCVSSNSHYALRLSKQLGTPVVATTQGELTMDAERIFETQPEMAALMRRTAREADLVTACSQKTLSDLEAFVGQQLTGARVIHNGVDFDSFAHAKPLELDAPYVLAIGRLVPQKGFDTLLQAWATIPRSRVKLVIAGEGPERHALEALARSHGVAASVEFFGGAGREVVPRLFAGATAVVLPSRADEGLPLVAVEALASGRALVASRTGGIAEVVTDGLHGLIVERDDSIGLARALERVLADEGLRTSLGRAGQERARDFDWNALADRYLDAFASVLRRDEA